jgi:hypothetical protein
MAGLLVIHTGGTSAYVIGSSRVAAQQNGRVALEMMVRELRSAASVTSIPSATDLTFVDEYNNTIRYSLSGAVINRTLNGVTTALIGGVVTFNLTYFSAYDGSTNTETPAPDNTQVKLVRIQLKTGSEVAVAEHADANQHAKMESWVRLRNL